MIFYHGTTKENWEKIKEEGVLYGRRFVLNNNGSINQEVSRCTYLAVDKEEAKQYGDVVLQVEYNPFINPKCNNYTNGCWQVRVYEPISLSQIKELKAKEESK